MRFAVVVSTELRGAEECPFARPVDGFLHRSAGTSAAPTVVDDWEIHGGAISDRIDGVRNTSPSPIAEELQGHEFRVPGYAGHLEAVVGCGRNGARNVGAVPVAVHWVVVVVAEIPSINVIHVTVAIVVLAIGDFTVFKYFLEVLVVVVDTRVDHGNDHVELPLVFSHAEGL